MMYRVTVWNESVERTYNIITDSRENAIRRAINQEIEVYRIPRYKIHIESVTKA